MLADGIAIIGLSGRFPGAPDVDRFWANLKDGAESISFFSEADLRAEGLSASLLERPDYVNAGGILPDVELFDAGFFGFNPREAEVLDPQHRVFLECAWEGLERAGYDPARFPEGIGVFAGAGSSGHLVRLHADPDLLSLFGSMHVSIGSEKDHLTTRVAYKLNLRGPAVGVQTTCSTSLVAVCLACQALASGQCQMALAGGVSVVVPQRTGYLYRQGGILSPDGHCRAFDARAQGAVGGNGCALVVLRRLSDALASGDHIHAVIRGYGLNNDGSVKVGYTAPSIDGQAQVIAMAQAMAGFDPASIGYVEAHGTGTPLGDPIEVAALTQAFRRATAEKGFCGIGSVKTNIGHLDAAAGGAGLIKAALAVEHGLLPLSLHFEAPNPVLELDESPFFVVSGSTEWGGDRPRRAGVSSFGIGGTNAHVVIEEAPAREISEARRPSQLLVLSARSPSSLDKMTGNLAAHLRSHPDLDLADAAFTLQLGRRAFEHRRTLVSYEATDAAEVLEGRHPRRLVTSHVDHPDRSTAFLFPGQGSQHPGMASRLYAAEPIFKAALDACAGILSEAGLDLHGLLGAAGPDAAERLRQTEFAQPALVAVEYALAKQLIAFGVRPGAMIGHSIGEYVAACLADVLSLEDMLRLVAQRGRLMQNVRRGAMLAVPLSEAEVSALPASGLSLAAVNAPSMCVLSGPVEAVDAVEAKLAGSGVVGRRLVVSHAFHSSMMEAIREDFLSAVRRVRLHPPRLPYISNLTGTWIRPEEATDPTYWWEHLRRTVQLADGLHEILQDSTRVLLEVGPGKTLSSFAMMQPARTLDHIVVSTLPGVEEKQPDVERTLDAIGRLWAAGLPVDFGSLWTHERRRRVPLPTYPFERKRYWVDTSTRRQVSGEQAAQSGKDPDVSRWFYEPSWSRTVPPPAGGRGGRWMVFSDRSGVGSAVAARLRDDGASVTEVRAGADFAETAEGLAIDPSRAEDYQRLLGRLGRPAHVVHAWSLDPGVSAGGAGERFRAAQVLGFDSVRLAIQALLAGGGREPVTLTVISDRAQEVTGQEDLRPEHTTLRAISTVVPQEHPHLACRSVDLALDGSGRGPTANQLYGELIAEPRDRFVAYRGPHRWVQHFVPAVRQPEKSSLLRQGGVYLITGGLGRIGLALASHLAATWQARLVLVGRSSTLDAAVAREIESRGGEVVAWAADVADPVRMRQVLDRTRQRFGSLNGVFHLAGATGRRAFLPVRQTDRGCCEEHFLPKAHGATVLADLLRDEPLDFVLLFSSLSSVLGGLGFLAYAAGNAYLDALAIKMRQASQTPWLSVSWDGWAFEEPARKGAAGAALAQLAMTPAEGLRALDLALGALSVPWQLVSTAHLEARLRTWVAPQQVAAGPDPQPASAQLHERPELSTRYQAPEGELESVVANLLGDLLGIERVGRNDNFFELGGHSLLAIQLTSRLRDLFHAEISIQELFDAPTVGDFCRRLHGVISGSQGDESRLSDLLNVVESLSDQEIAALMAEEASAESPGGAGAALLLAPEVTVSGTPNGNVREFYDRVTAQLDASEAGPYATFLNFGYAADGSPGSPGSSPIELPTNALNRNSMQLVLETIGDCDLAGRRVLDVGCGRGGTLVTVARYFRPGLLVGVDLSMQAVRFCIQHHRSGGLRFLTGDAQRLPFADASFDAAINIESSHSYLDRGAFLREVHRILVRNGAFLYTDLLPSADLPARLVELRAAGFTLESDRDITRNVLLSCDEVAKRRLQVFPAANDRELMGDFLGVPGSHVYEDLRTGRSTYRIWRLVKAE